MVSIAANSSASLDSNPFHFIASFLAARDTILGGEDKRITVRIILPHQEEKHNIKYRKIFDLYKILCLERPAGKAKATVLEVV